MRAGFRFDGAGADRQRVDIGGRAGDRRVGAQPPASAPTDHGASSQRGSSIRASGRTAMRALVVGARAAALPVEDGDARRAAERGEGGVGPRGIDVDLELDVALPRAPRAAGSSRPSRTTRRSARDAAPDAGQLRRACVSRWRSARSIAAASSAARSYGSATATRQRRAPRCQLASGRGERAAACDRGRRRAPPRSSRRARRARRRRRPQSDRPSSVAARRG